MSKAHPYKYLYLAQIRGKKDLWKVGVSSNYKKRFDFLELQSGLCIDMYYVWTCKNPLKYEEIILNKGLRAYVPGDFGGKTEFRIFNPALLERILSAITAEIGRDPIVYISPNMDF